jgi:UDP:flavonoid glycosyltransferase YjiC (YdhE family)
MRSGRPTLIVPYNYDQPDNAERIARLGAGRTLTRDRCTAATLTAELQQLLFNPSYAARAAQLSQIVNSENGAATACDALLSLAR